MNVASLELCKELYELSGWGKTQNVWAIATGEENKDVSPWLRVGVGSSSAWEELPAYDAGYLLRKLPASVKIKGHPYVLELRPNYSGSAWSALYYDPEKAEAPIQVYDNAPEDCLTKLAIQLFKAGILTKETL